MHVHLRKDRRGKRRDALRAKSLPEGRYRDSLTQPCPLAFWRLWEPPCSEWIRKSATWRMGLARGAWCMCMTGCVAPASSNNTDDLSPTRGWTLMTCDSCLVVMCCLVAGFALVYAEGQGQEIPRIIFGCSGSCSRSKDPPTEKCYLGFFLRLLDSGPEASH